VLGGPTATSSPALVLGAMAADFAVVGEGELTLIELLDHLLARPGAPGPRDIAGLAWKDAEGRVVVNPGRPQMKDLDAVPLQDLEAWPAVQAGGRVPELYMTYSRGCSGDCSFCFRAMPRLALKSPARVRAELRHLARFGFRMVWWSDLTFTASEKLVDRVLDAIGDHDFRWCCFTRADRVSTPMLGRMRERGCDLVMYGFESVTPSILATYDKRTPPGAQLRAIEATRTAGLKVGGLFIIGAPGETHESLAATVEFCRRVREVTRVKYLSLLPGTALYRWARREGLVGDEALHLRFLSRERSVEDDEIINVCGLPDELLRTTYREVNRLVEQRPYEYWNPVDRFLDEPRGFARRPSPGGLPMPS
jgi:anaerobic magnesium-protoporphyrin IX monomethyl ester cyclase